MKVSRRLIADVSLSAFSLLARMGAGIATFVMIARQLPVEDFGRFSAVFAAAALLALPTNFGFNILILKNASEDAGKVAGQLGDVLRAKIRLSLIFAPVFLTTAFFLSDYALLFGLLYLATVVESFTDVFFSGYRAIGDYKKEGKVTTVLALLHIAVVFGVVVQYKTLMAAGVAYFFSKAIALGAVVGFDGFAKRALQSKAKSDVMSTLKSSGANFIELSLQTVLVQIDSLIISAFSSVSQVATYQAVMKLVHGLSQGITLLVNVLLPRVAQAQSAKKRTLQIRRTLIFMGGIGLVVAACFSSVASFIDRWMYHGKFEGIVELIHLAAVFLAVRFLAAGFGIRMIALGHSSLRVAGLCVALCFQTVLGIVLVRSYGAVGMMAAMILAYIAIAGVAVAGRSGKASPSRD
jgi:O-antigen/teichoic acid export membrane protein